MHEKLPSTCTHPHSRRLVTIPRESVPYLGQKLSTGLRRELLAFKWVLTHNPKAVPVTVQGPGQRLFIGEGCHCFLLGLQRRSVGRRRAWLPLQAFAPQLGEETFAFHSSPSPMCKRQPFQRHNESSLARGGGEPPANLRWKWLAVQSYTPLPA